MKKEGEKGSAETTNNSGPYQENKLFGKNKGEGKTRETGVRTVQIVLARDQQTQPGDHRERKDKK